MFCKFFSLMLVVAMAVQGLGQSMPAQNGHPAWDNTTTWSTIILNTESVFSPIRNSLGKKQMARAAADDLEAEYDIIISKNASVTSDLQAEKFTTGGGPVAKAAFEAEQAALWARRFGDDPVWLAPLEYSLILDDIDTQLDSLWDWKIEAGDYDYNQESFDACDVICLLTLITGDDYDSTKATCVAYKAFLVSLKAEYDTLRADIASWIDS